MNAPVRTLSWKILRLNTISKSSRAEFIADYGTDELPISINLLKVILGVKGMTVDYLARSLLSPNLYRQFSDQVRAEDVTNGPIIRQQFNQDQARVSKLSSLMIASQLGIVTVIVALGVLGIWALASWFGDISMLWGLLYLLGLVMLMNFMNRLTFGRFEHEYTPLRKKIGSIQDRESKIESILEARRGQLFLELWSKWYPNVEGGEA